MIRLLTEANLNESCLAGQYAEAAKEVEDVEGVGHVEDAGPPPPAPPPGMAAAPPGLATSAFAQNKTKCSMQRKAELTTSLETCKKIVQDAAQAAEVFRSTQHAATATLQSPSSAAPPSAHPSQTKSSTTRTSSKSTTARHGTAAARAGQGQGQRRGQRGRGRGNPQQGQGQRQRQPFSARIQPP